MLLYILSFCYRPKIHMPDAPKERPIFNRSEFGARKGLLIQKVQLEKIGELIFKFILREFEFQASFIKGMEKELGKG